MDFTVEPRKRFLPENPADISSLSAELSDDRRKVRVKVVLNRDDTRPDLDLKLIDAEDIELFHSTIIENIGAKVDFTLHIRKETITFPLLLICRISYVDEEIKSEKEVPILNECS
jgi:hypothetical protein